MAVLCFFWFSLSRNAFHLTPHFLLPTLPAIRNFVPNQLNNCWSERCKKTWKSFQLEKRSQITVCCVICASGTYTQLLNQRLDKWFYVCYWYLAAYELCRDNYITEVSFPLHTSIGSIRFKRFWNTKIMLINYPIWSIIETFDVDWITETAFLKY